MSVKNLHSKFLRHPNFLSRLSSITMTGLGPQSLSFLPDDRQHHGMETETVALLPVLRRLEVQVGGQGAAQSLSGLRLLLEHLSLRGQSNPMVGAMQEEMDTSQAPLSEKIGTVFIQERGIELILTLLMAGSGNLETNPISVKGRLEDSNNVKQKKLAMDVLCKLCVVNKSAPEILGETDELLIFCFHHMTHPDLYEKCCQMIEHILMARPHTLNLCAIPHLAKVLASLDGGRLASFCKILAVTVSDLDIFENKS